MHGAFALSAAVRSSTYPFLGAIFMTMFLLRSRLENGWSAK